MAPNINLLESINFDYNKGITEITRKMLYVLTENQPKKGIFNGVLQIVKSQLPTLERHNPIWMRQLMIYFFLFCCMLGLTRHTNL